VILFYLAMLCSQVSAEPVLGHSNDGLWLVLGTYLVPGTLPEASVCSQSKVLVSPIWYWYHIYENSTKCEWRMA